MPKHPRQRTIVPLMACAMLGFVSAVTAATPASAEIEYPYCLLPSAFTVGTCSYSTYEQCAATASGNIGVCIPNPRFKAATSPRQTRARG